MYKRTVSMVLVIAVLLLLTGCGKSAEHLYPWSVGEESARVFADTLNLSVAEGGVTPTGVEVCIENPTDALYCYGAEFYLEVWQDNAWHTMDAGLDATAEERFIDPGASRTEGCSWPSELEAGRYRFIKEFYPDGKYDEAFFVSVEFQLN